MTETTHSFSERTNLILNLKDNIQSALTRIDQLIDFAKDVKHELEGEYLKASLNHFSHGGFSNNNQLDLLNNYFLRLFTLAENIFNTTMWNATVNHFDNKSKWHTFNGLNRSTILQQLGSEKSPSLSTTTFFTEIYKPQSKAEIALFNLKQETETVYQLSRDQIAHLKQYNLTQSLTQIYSYPSLLA